MPRGCDNPRSRFNNQPSAMPWTWLRIVKDGPRFRIANDRGAHLRGPGGRLRLFKSALSAQLAADIEMGVA